MASNSVSCNVMGVQGYSSRRAFLRGALALVTGAACALAVGSGPLANLARVAGQDKAATRHLICASCSRSVDTRAGYVICRSCDALTCPRCTRARGGEFVCPSCDSWSG